MNSVLLERCIWEGATERADSYGVIICAQNAEFVNMIQPYFSPNWVKKRKQPCDPTKPQCPIDRYHKHHIYFPHYVGRAGVTVFGMLSTRAWSYAIKNPSQLNIYGWRSEDHLLVDWGFAVGTDPVTSVRSPSAMLVRHTTSHGRVKTRASVFSEKARPSSSHQHASTGRSK